MLYIKSGLRPLFKRAKVQQFMKGLRPGVKREMHFFKKKRQQDCLYKKRFLTGCKAWSAFRIKKKRQQAWLRKAQPCFI